MFGWGMESILCSGSWRYSIAAVNGNCLYAKNFHMAVVLGRAPVVNIPKADNLLALGGIFWHPNYS